MLFSLHNRLMDSRRSGNIEITNNARILLYSLLTTWNPMDIESFAKFIKAFASTRCGADSGLLENAPRQNMWKLAIPSPSDRVNMDSLQGSLYFQLSPAPASRSTLTSTKSMSLRAFSFSSMLPHFAVIWDTRSGLPGSKCRHLYTPNVTNDDH